MELLLFNTDLSLSSVRSVECHCCHWRTITSRLFVFYVLWQGRKMKNKTGKSKWQACCCTPLYGWKLLSILLMWPHLSLSCLSRWVSGRLSCLWWRDKKEMNEMNWQGAEQEVLTALCGSVWIYVWSKAHLSLAIIMQWFFPYDETEWQFCSTVVVMF